MAKKRKNGRLKEIAVDVLLVLFVLGLVGFGTLSLWIATLDIPDLSAFDQRRVLQSTKIYDRTGEILLYDLHQDVKRTVVGYDDISHHIKNATIALEDDAFFEHIGVRPLSILRSMVTNIKNGGSPFSGAGGSTITQQVIKNSILVQEKTLTRKIKEAILAIRLEQSLTKEEILTHYLNEAPYGGTIYGVEEASLAFFGKRASEVTLAEAAYLAALPQAPTYYSPYGSNTDDLEARKNHALDRMLLNGFITEEEHSAAKSEEVSFRQQESRGLRAPHFVFYIREYLARKYGETSLAERGFKVVTTLDWELQREAEDIVREYALSNEQTFDASNAALVAADPQTGEILTMVGSRDYFDEDIDGNFNVAVNKSPGRQPGSAFKPFVYAQAFREGYTPNTVLFDLKTQFSTSCAPDNLTSEDGCYSPTNYDDEFRGPVTMKNALAQSLNIPAVKTLYLAGINDSIKLARDMGITTLDGSGDFGLTLVLGGAEVSLLDMVSAYSVFANEGVRTEPVSILRIEDSNGEVIEEAETKQSRVLERNVALQISDVLSDNVARTPLYGANSLMYFPGRDVAAKTGTTNDRRDAWILGYTPNLVVGAWAGNNDNHPMNNLSGLIITPLWRAYMDVALQARDEETFPQAVEPSTNKAVLNGVWFSIPGTEDGSLDVLESVADAHSILYYVDKNNPTGAIPSNPNQDSQYRYWEYAVEQWKRSLLNN
ncbi:transglycosylase domain-containing protein [Candidatus Kaiserbacteria bacterium]|nr:transglycosylase domain-containing protein [Candidatus Kaiserbacteria bacterium]